MSFSESHSLRLCWSARRELLSHVKAEDWRVGVLQRASFAWQSAWFSLNDRLQEKAYAEALSEVRLGDAPIFVLGFWRSGTTLLHELLCCDERFGYPTTAQCMNPSTMLLAKAPGVNPEATLARPMDGLPVSTSSPQEDEFALLALGLPSAYRFLLTPGDVESSLHALDPDDWSEMQRTEWSEGFLRFVRRIQLCDSRPLVFKSPTHSCRVPMLRALWPDARFVAIHRNPIDVWHSNLRLWRMLCEEYALTRWRESDIESFVSEAYRLFSRKLAAARSALEDTTSYLTCSFERLIANPVQELESLYTGLGLEVTRQVRLAWQDYLARREGHRPRHYDTSKIERIQILDRLGVI